MARPHLNPAKPLDFTSRVVLNKTEYEFILKCAQQEGISFSQLMRNAAADYLSKKGYKATPKRQTTKAKNNQLPDLY